MDAPESVRGTAPYNMAVLVGGSETESYRMGDSSPLRGVVLDKLWCECLALGVEPWRDIDVESVPGGAVCYGERSGRRQGMAPVIEWPYLLFGQSGDDGVARVVFREVRDGLLSRRYVRVEFNPAKIRCECWAWLGAFMRSVQADSARWLVRRFDVACDYCLPRPILQLDVGRMKPDFLGVVAGCPETERAGYRKGSSLRVQLYDKAAERARATDHDDWRGVVRFELQAYPRASTGGVPSLADLHAVEWPGGDVTVRHHQFGLPMMGPADGRLEWYASLVARVGGVPAARRMMKHHASPERGKTWLVCMLPEVVPSPREAFAKHFPWSVSATRSQLGLRVNQREAVA